MKTIIFTIVISYICSSDVNSTLQPSQSKIINQDVTDEIKRKTTNWIPYNPEANPLRKYTDSQLKRMLGMPGIDFKKYKDELYGKNRLLTSNDFNLSFSNIKIGKVSTAVKSRSSNVFLPEYFDWTETYIGKHCTPPIGDQGFCGACYAFAASAVFSSRLCAAKYSHKNKIELINFSAQDILSCNVHTEQCKGGMIDLAFSYIEKYGVTDRKSVV